MIFMTSSPFDLADVEDFKQWLPRSLLLFSTCCAHSRPMTRTVSPCLRKQVPQALKTDAVNPCPAEIFLRQGTVSQNYPWLHLKLHRLHISQRNWAAVDILHDCNLRAESESEVCAHPGWPWAAIVLALFQVCILHSFSRSS